MHLRTLSWVVTVVVGCGAARPSPPPASTEDSSRGPVSDTSEPATSERASEPREEASDAATLSLADGSLCSRYAERERSDVSFPRPTPEAQANALIREARAARTAHDLTLAIAAYENAIDVLDLDPVERTEGLRCEAALAYRDAGDLLTAEEVVRLGADSAPCWYNLGLVLESAGRLGEAHHAFGMALERRRSEVAAAAYDRTATLPAWTPDEAVFAELGSELRDPSDDYERNEAEMTGRPVRFDRSFLRPAGVAPDLEVRMFLHRGPTIAVRSNGRLYHHRIPWDAEFDDDEHLRDERVVRRFRVLEGEPSRVLIELLLSATYTPNDQFAANVVHQLYVIELGAAEPTLWSADLGGFDFSEALEAPDGPRARPYRFDASTCADWHVSSERLRIEPLSVLGGDRELIEGGCERCPPSRAMTVTPRAPIDTTFGSGSDRVRRLSWTQP